MGTNAEKIKLEVNERHNSKLYYKLTKLNYLEDLRQFLEGSDEKSNIWTRENIREKIKEIKETWSISRKIANEYDIALLNGEEILIISETTKQVIPFEDYFDVFIDVHNQFGHLKQSEMLKRLSTQYAIEESVLGIFMNSCNSCSKAVSYRKSYNELVHIDILGMVHKPDYDFHYMLLYVEVASNFILLRPLMNTGPNEVASELYKIFIDFGPPLAITATNSHLLNKVMLTLKLTPVKYDIPIYPNKKFHKMSGTCLIELEKWLTYSSSNNWAFGCYVVQYILNTKGEFSAKNKVFGKKHDKPLKIPYELQSDTNADNPNNVVSMDNEHAQSIKQNVTESASNLNSMLHESVFHVEEDLGIDLIKVESENKEDDIEEKLDYAIIPNRLDKPEACSVCSKRGLSELVKCSVCANYVHLICAERLPLPEYENTDSKIVCSKC